MEKIPSIDAVKLIPVYLLFIGTFLQASLEKFFSGGVPDWFRNQFSKTLLNAFPGALGIQYYAIAFLEFSVVILFLISGMRMEFLPGANRDFFKAALVLALFTFFALGFGLRMSGDYQGAANLFMYFGVTFIILAFISVGMV
jgi:hypothetical protein